jgi:hypothetical protein
VSEGYYKNTSRFANKQKNHFLRHSIFGNLEKEINKSQYPTKKNEKKITTKKGEKATSFLGKFFLSKKN